METTKRSASKGKRKAASIGAPAQVSQTTRKGKRAWRKNVDITEIEDGIDSLREEERETGGKIRDKSDAELFQVDVIGDEEVRKRIQKQKKPLRFLQVLANRSAVPAVHSRPSQSSSARLTQEEKAKLLQKTKRLRKGALNSYLDPTEAGSAVVEPRSTGRYDVWGAMESDDEKVVKRIKTDEGKEYILPLVQKPKIKPPPSVLPSKDIELPAINAPHPGTSYNPSVAAHQELLRKAHEIELQREAESQKWQKAKDSAEALKKLRIEGDEKVEFGGMILDVPVTNDPPVNDVEEDDKEPAMRKAPVRKTKSQRLKAARLLAEKRVLAQKASSRRLAASLSNIKSLSRSADQKLTSNEQTVLALKQRKEQLLREGMAGRKLGKHVVKTGEIDVQLGEELSESLRGLQPEGNLFKDRFLSLQHRALVEPREAVLPKKKRVKYKEYEKHPWKRFS